MKHNMEGDRYVHTHDEVFIAESRFFTGIGPIEGENTASLICLHGLKPACCDELSSGVRLNPSNCGDIEIGASPIHMSAALKECVAAESYASSAWGPSLWW